MGSAFDTGVSALIASQRQLSTTSHNIANINTDGYTRQRVDLTQRPPQFVGGGYLGNGVDVSAIARTANDFLTTQLRNTTAGEARASTYLDLASQVDAAVSSGTFGPAVTQFFNSLQDVNNHPSSIPARQVFLTAAKTLTQRFQDLDSRFAELTTNVNNGLTQRVGAVNTLATSLANLNTSIVHALGVAQGQPPNDLLDQRDALLKKLSSLVNISTLPQQDGGLNVFIGNGQLLVAGSNPVALTTVRNPLDNGRTEVAMKSGGTTTIISDALTNGEMAGLLGFRDQLLDPSRNASGRLAAAVNFSMNAQHRAGMDLNGQLGGDLFAIGSPAVNAAPANVGGLAVAIDPSNLGALTNSDYSLTYNGANFTLTRATDGVQQTLSGAGPFAVDGMTIAVSSAPAAGDRYLIQPTRYLARNMTLLVNDPAKVAVANPVKTSAALGNVSTAAVSPPQVLDSTNVNLLVSTQLVFNNPPTTFQINGAGPLVSFTSGSNIDLNGWRVQIKGSPVAGDTFNIAANTNGAGDNVNGLALRGLQTKGILAGGATSIQNGYAQLVSSAGASAQQAQITSDALKIQTANAQSARDAMAGVNMDEEAANLVKFQQAYQAAAQVIQITNSTFQSLLNAMR
ncbi:MAG: flagellar hook-associated protein FlgK [Gammaproteobacteria bacterium]|nr:flagellar hook-associated protein FlgK [Gammaproteobacteria bacterium]